LEGASQLKTAQGQEGRLAPAPRFPDLIKQFFFVLKPIQPTENFLDYFTETLIDYPNARLYEAFPG
jgi:hypothetical protein